MRDNPRILIIEDDHDIVLGLSLRLRAAGYGVVTAHDGQAGLAEAKRTRPDAIVLDLRMPVMDGLTVLVKLGEDADTKAIPVVVVSANVAETARQKALAHGARYFLEKPYDAAKLMQALQSILSWAPSDPPERTTSQDPPERTTSQAPPKHTTSQEGRPAQSGKTVLIADDDRAVVQVLTLRCQMLGLFVRTAADGMDALTQIVKELPELAILDIDMPALDGLSICEYLMTDPNLPPFPVIFLTGKSDDESIRRCESVGAHYVHKGIDAWDSLKSKIFELLPELAKDLAAGDGEPPARRALPKVLLVDDDALICRAIKIRLEGYGIEIRQARNGTQGFWMALKELPDVIVSDLNMPDSCGNRLLGRLKSSDITKDIPIIFLSGHKLGNKHDYGLERDLLSRGAAAFLHKPLEFDELLKQLRWHIEFPERPQVA